MEVEDNTQAEVVQKELEAIKPLQLPLFLPDTLEDKDKDKTEEDGTSDQLVTHGVLSLVPMEVDSNDSVNGDEEEDHSELQTWLKLLESSITELETNGVYYIHC